MTQHLDEITKEYAKLTKHPSGSIKELFAISFPLMLSFLSNYLMLFFDRLIIANYSLEAMNAVTAASLFCMIFQMGAIGIASIAEVFVGQYNGSKQYSKVAMPVWQMIWFSLMCFPVFFFLAKFGGPIFLTDYYYQEYAFPYYKWIMYFNITFAIQTAVSAFFIGTGKVKIVTIATVLANIINIALDILLIFGIKGIVPSFGTKGAAFATGFAQIFQIAFLLIFFLSFKNREKYNTHHLTFRPKILKKCLRIGFPSAVGHMIEITAWALVMNMMAVVSGTFLTVMAVGQNIYVVIAFATSGLQKAVSTVSANLIGAKNYLKVAKSWFSAVKLLLIFAAIVSLVLLVYPDPLINAFLAKETSKANIAELFTFIRITCVFLWVYFIVDGLTWVSAGILTAAGDTMFIMVMNAFGAWCFALIPIYFFVYKNPTWPPLVWVLMDFYGLMNAISFYLRYRYKKARGFDNKVLSK